MFANATPVISMSEQVGDAVKSLTSRYDHYLKQVDQDPMTGGDIVVDCIDMTYKKWAISYLNIIEQASSLDINPIKDPLNEFAVRYFMIDQKQQIAERVRPNIINLLSQVVQSLYSEPKYNLHDLNVSSITINQIQEDSYVRNMKMCLSKVFKNKILPLAATPDLTAVNPGDFSRVGVGDIEWVKGPSGGYRPVFTAKSQYNLAFRSNYFKNINSLSYSILMTAKKVKQ